MKKGKKGWFLLMAFTMWAALIAGCGKWPGNKPDKVPEVTTAGAQKQILQKIRKMFRLHRFRIFRS